MVRPDRVCLLLSLFFCSRGLGLCRVALRDFFTLGAEGWGLLRIGCAIRFLKMQFGFLVCSLFGVDAKEAALSWMDDHRALQIGGSGDEKVVRPRFVL